jgi:hypothetical protein
MGASLVPRYGPASFQTPGSAIDSLNVSARAALVPHLPVRLRLRISATAMPCDVGGLAAHHRAALFRKLDATVTR